MEDFRLFSADLPKSRKLAFGEVDECNEFMARSGINQELLQLKQGKMRAEVATCGAAGVELYSDRFSHALTARLQAPDQHFILLFPRSAKPPMLASGSPLDNGDLLLIPPNHTADIKAPELSGSDSIMISEQRLLALLDALCPATKLPQARAVIRRGENEMAKLRSAIVGWTATPEPGHHEEGFSHLLVSLAHCLAAPCERLNKSNSHATGSTQRAAERIGDYLRANYPETVRLEDICRELRLPARTLQRHFSNYFGLSVSDYLNTIRLNAARRLLLARDPDTSSVASVALEVGCSHLGRFSGAYRNHFHESPRTTLSKCRVNTNKSH